MIFLSRIEEKKGLEILFDALADIGIPYRLTIAGDGEPSYISKLKALARKNDIEKHLDWIGFRKDDKFDILQEHHIMVLPSYDENFGNVVIESLSMGTSVLLSKNVGLAGYVEENNLGWVCENNAPGFSNMIRIIHKDPNKLTEIRERAPVKIRLDFDEENLRKRYMHMYRQIIKND
jgi:glycosyltransferase involved in cell wall biosynthesis